MDFLVEYWSAIVAILGFAGTLWVVGKPYLSFFKESGDVIVTYQNGGTDAEIGKEFREAAQAWPKSVQKKAEKLAAKNP